MKSITPGFLFLFFALGTVTDGIPLGKVHNSQLILGSILEGPTRLKVAGKNGSQDQILELNWEEHPCYPLEELVPLTPIQSCVRLFKGEPCNGLSIALYPGSPYLLNQTLIPLGKQDLSLGPCLENEFDNAEVFFLNNSNGKGGEAQVKKNSNLSASFQSIPDLMQFDGNDTLDGSGATPQLTEFIGEGSFITFGIRPESPSGATRLEYVWYRFGSNNSDLVISLLNEGWADVGTGKMRIDNNNGIEVDYASFNELDSTWTVGGLSGASSPKGNKYPSEFRSKLVKSINNCSAKLETDEQVVDLLINFIYSSESSSAPLAFTYSLESDATCVSYGVNRNTITSL